MKPDYWLQQTPGQPAFADMVWSRPENRQLAGKLLIIGGHQQGFAVPAEAYSEAGKAGIGTTRVLLPDSLIKTVVRIFPEAEFAPTTPSGSFSRLALAELLAASAWADGVLLAGDFGKNSETAVLLEAFAHKYPGQLVLTGDAIDYFLPLPFIQDREQTLLVPSFSQLQKLSITGHAPRPLTSKLDLLHMVEAVHELMARHATHILFEHERTVFAAATNKISTTRFSVYDKPSDLQLAAHAAVWWLQNPAKPFESLAAAIATLGTKA